MGEAGERDIDNRCPDFKKEFEAPDEKADQGSMFNRWDKVSLLRFQITRLVDRYKDQNADIHIYFFDNDSKNVILPALWKQVICPNDEWKMPENVTLTLMKMNTYDAIKYGMASSQVDCRLFGIYDPDLH